MPRVPVPLTVLPQAPPLTECTECARCCSYVAVGINAPTTVRLATDVLWYLYHESVCVYVDGDGEWSVVFETRCRNLAEDLRCGIYAERPHICRSFDNRSCEVNAPNEAALMFRAPAAFLAWLLKTRPRLCARIEQGFVPQKLRPKARARTARAGQAARPQTRS